MRARTRGFSGRASDPTRRARGNWLFLVACAKRGGCTASEARDAERTVELAAAERLEDRRLDPEPPVALRDALARMRPRQRRLLTMQAAGLR
jgi:hypothetical protein